MKQDIRKAFDTVRCQDGLKERTRSHVLGRMRQRQPKPAMHRMKLIVSLACLLVFAGSGFGGYQLYYAEAATISIDVNPSIELGINRWGRVIEEVPYGRDGETVLREVSLRHLEYEEALERLIGSEAMQDYLKKMPCYPLHWKTGAAVTFYWKTFKSVWTPPSESVTARPGQNMSAWTATCAGKPTALACPWENTMPYRNCSPQTHRPPWMSSGISP